MTPNLEKAIAELEELRAEVKAKTEEVRALAVEEAQKIITAVGISANELKFGGEEKNTRKPAGVKYVSPDGTKTWSGRGRQPKWITELVNAGVELSTLKRN